MEALSDWIGSCRAMATSGQGSLAGTSEKDKIEAMMHVLDLIMEDLDDLVFEEEKPPDDEEVRWMISVQVHMADQDGARGQSGYAGEYDASEVIDQHVDLDETMEEVDHTRKRASDIETDTASGSAAGQLAPAGTPRKFGVAPRQRDQNKKKQRTGEVDVVSNLVNKISAVSREETDRKQ